MDLPLPSGFTARPPAQDDLDEVVALVIACDLLHIGEADFEAADLQSDWDAAGPDLERDARVVVADEGDIAAYAHVQGADAFVHVHPDRYGQGLGAALVGFADERAAARGAGVVRQQVDGGNDRARALLGDHGYRIAEHHWRMRIALDRGDAPSEPVWPAGIQARTFLPGEDDAAAHALIQEAFSEIPGFVARGLEEWRPGAIGRPQFAPSLSWVAEEDGRMVGVATCEAWDAEGYVALLAAARSHRGRGLGRALLLTSFDGFRSAGMPAASLSVNTANETGKGLYESVGMEVAWRAERWEKRLN